jgi:glucan endo-1,3-beta-D-glucosidase
MHANSLLAIAATLAAASAATIQGFNYGSTNPDGSPAQQSDYQGQFQAAKQLAGTNGAFTAARLYTTIVSFPQLMYHRFGC